MSALNRIAYFQNRRDEVLEARKWLKNSLAHKDEAGIREIAEHLWDKGQKHPGRLHQSAV